MHCESIWIHWLKKKTATANDQTALTQQALLQIYVDIVLSDRQVDLSLFLILSYFRREAE